MDAEKVTVERMVELLAVRLLELGLNDDGGGTAAVERERAFALAFCGEEAVDEELAGIVVELAAAAMLEQSAALAADGDVQSVKMGDVSVSYAEGGAAGQKELAAGIYRQAIIRLSARRGIKW